ncbi:small kinetochore-associated protein [Hyla sarda]|uniref:small kinetochore-associated protein n=1 Tax=Hyla sarda TaxID=327740 RepID=UPI0024C34AEF|nr:small kinetochore-associated protein [Hyla sarda]
MVQPVVTLQLPACCQPEGEGSYTVLMERSKLPVLRGQGSDLPLPSAKKPCPQKPTPFESRDPNIAFSSAAPNFVFKAGGNGKKMAVLKKTGPPVRGPIQNRYRMETELKEKNQLLEAANANLYNNLSLAQKTIEEMSEQKDSMKEELKELERRLEKSMIILESRNIDPGNGTV